MIAHSIRRLGFDPDMIRVLLIGHAHIDHAGAIAWFKKRTGARLEVMDDDVASVEDGGRSDFAYGNRRLARFPRATVDRILADGDTVRLGEIVLTANKTPGHTPGATTWTTSLLDQNKSYEVALVDGFGVNPGYRLVGNASYPEIADDYSARG